MYKVKVNDKINFDIAGKHGDWWVNGENIALDVQTIVNGRSTHILYKNKSYSVEFIEANVEEKTQIIKVNGKMYTVAIADEFDLLLKELGMDMGLSNKILEIKAPMPGLVLKVMVKVGSEVKKGDSLLVLEAMKMENILKSSTDGVVSKVFITEGDKIEKNAVLIQFK